MEQTIGSALEQLAKSFTVAPATPAAPAEQAPAAAPAAGGGTYVLTSEKFAGFITYEFNDDGMLTSYNTAEAKLTNHQLTYLANRMPNELGAFKESLKGSKTYKLERMKVTAVTFPMFWDKYNEKANSSKKKAETKWFRMPQSQRNRAYHYIDAYLRNIPPGVAKKYAETYLNAELWNN